MEEKQTNSHGHHWIKIRVFSSSSSTGYMRKPEEKQRGGKGKKKSWTVRLGFGETDLKTIKRTDKELISISFPDPEVGCDPPPYWFVIRIVNAVLGQFLLRKTHLFFLNI